MYSNSIQPNLSDGSSIIPFWSQIRLIYNSSNQVNRILSTSVKAFLLFICASFVTQVASAQLNLSFSSYKLKSGTDGALNAKYLFTKVNDTLDCIVTIKAINNSASLTILDDNSGTYGGNVARFQPIISVPKSSKNNSSYIQFNFQLIKTGTYNNGSGTNIIPSDPVWFRAYDIDGNGVDNGAKEFVELSNVFTGTWVDAPSQLVSKSAISGGSAYTISNSNINGGNLSDNHTLAFNGFIYANTISSWDIIGGATVGSNNTSPTVTNDPTNIGDGDRINSWSFTYTDVIPGVDFGDAPSTYNIPTGGTGTIIPAYHIVPSDASTVTVYLGSVKPDIDYDPSGNASGTTDDKNNIIDDEDAFQSTYFPKYSGSGAYTCTVSATNTSGSNAYIYGYIDFNGDGSFDATTEKSAMITVPSKSGIQYFTATFSGNFTYNASSNNRYARFRISSTSTEVASPTGRATNGEVEDYRFNTAMKISGVVYDDANGNTDNLINGTGKALMGAAPLYATLLDTAGKVLQTVTIKSDGSYTFDSAGTNNTFKVIVSTINSLFGTTPLVTTLNALQSGYVYTSEGVTAVTAAGDKLASGNYSTTTAITDITTMNFGWDALPETYSNTSITINSPNNNTKYPLTASPLTGSDPEDNPTARSITTGGTFIIKTLPTGATLYYTINNVVTAVTGGQKITSFDPSKFFVQFSTSGTKTFTYQTVDAAGMPDPTPATYAITSNAVLPLNDIVLSANLQSGVVKLTLVAKDENQVANYTWEQSTDGANFTTIGSMAYQANNASSNTYNFSTTPTGTSNVVYFRSIQHNVDGSTLISNMVVVKLNESASTQAVAMPTIIKDIVNIKISSISTQTVNLNVADNAGRLVMRKQVTLSVGSNTFAVDGWDRLSNGSYYIQIIGIDNQSVLKVIVQH